ncbi:MAG: Gfo/Idh/MocA family oxidoreductase [Acidobacteriia bacterium]|nr:Gfo/Idh/MocA family oxidoreductase [Terriglobia bacterium]
MRRLSRREFTRRAAAAGLATALSQTRVFGASDRIRLGFIGLGNRGDQVLDGFLAHRDAEVVAICDLHQPYLDFAAKKIGANPKQFKDYRQVLDLKDLDAVVICTPDHWHALQMIHACQAGKDVYVEKPLALCVSEGRRMVAAARRYNRVTQVGLMRRSAPLCKEAVDLVRAGRIGKITTVRSFHIQNEWPNGIGKPPDEDPPAGFDWDAWLGPAPKVPYNRNRTFYRFRWFYDYSGGQVTNFGAHYLDLTHWMLGHDAPQAVTAMGGKIALDDNREIPDTLEVLWTYPGGTLVIFSQFNANGAPADLHGDIMEVRGTKGTLYLTWNGYEVTPEETATMDFPALTPLDRSLGRRWETSRKVWIEPHKAEGADSTALHERNFLDCVRSREKCHCDIETGHRSTATTLIANIAHKTRSYLEWDAASERFTNNDEANKLLSYTYRAPYELPEV